MYDIYKSPDGKKWTRICSIKDLQTAYNFAVDRSLIQGGFFRIVDSYIQLN